MSLNNKVTTIHPESTLWLRLARIAWYFTAVISLAILAAAIPGYLFHTSLGVFEDRLSYDSSPLLLAIHRLSLLVSFLSGVLSLSLAVMLFVKKHADRMALFLSFYFLAHGILLAGTIELLQPYWPAAPWVNSFVLLPVFIGPGSMALLGLFPDGRFVPSWSRWLIPYSLFFLPLSIWGGNNLLPIELTTMNIIILVVLFLLTVVPCLAGIYAQVYRYRYVSSPAQRQQSKWVFYGFSLWFVTMALSSLSWVFAINLPPGTAVPWWLPLGEVVWVSATLFLPLSLTIAVMRYRLFDIDLIINRTLVYSVLTAITMGIYVFIVGYLGNLFQAQNKTIIAFLATGLVALIFQPMRQSLQSAVNRLMYGERDDPFGVISKLGERMEAASTPTAVLTDLVESVALALKLPFVAIVTIKNDVKEVTAYYGESTNDLLEIPLIYHREKIGHLVVAQRGGNEEFGPDECKLLETIAHQTSAAVHANSLTADLQRSRERLVSAREEERRRLRRDLHDGLGASLAALHLQTGVLRRMIRPDPNFAETMVEEFRQELQEAITDIRRLVYKLRPPALDELGLVPALRSLAARRGNPTHDGKNNNPEDHVLQIHVDAPDELPPLTAAIEVAVYRLVQEALTNVIHHAQANHCFVRLYLAENLQVEITDDGVGIPINHKSGIGMLSMRERAAELGGTCVIEPAQGGGTRVWACWPMKDN